MYGMKYGQRRTILFMTMASKKYKRKFLKPTLFDSKDHVWVGIVWPVTGSKGDQYSVELHDEGFECDCPGFGWHGYCKHSRAIVKQVEGAMR